MSPQPRYDMRASVCSSGFGRSADALFVEVTMVTMIRSHGKRGGRTKWTHLFGEIWCCSHRPGSTSQSRGRRWGGSYETGHSYVKPPGMNEGGERGRVQNDWSSQSSQSSCLSGPGALQRDTSLYIPSMIKAADAASLAL